MNNSTIGVISTPDGRSQRDLQLQKEFSCARHGQPGQRVVGDSVTVLGFNTEERSVRDKQILAEFSCSRENYSTPKMIYPRSPKDVAMLKEFNPGVCHETFQYQGSHSGQREKIARRDLSSLGRMNAESYGCPCGCPGQRCNCPRNCPCGCNNVENYQALASLNYNPYNTSSNVTYVPLR